MFDKMIQGLKSDVLAAWLFFVIIKPTSYKKRVILMLKNLLLSFVLVYQIQDSGFLDLDPRSRSTSTKLEYSLDWDQISLDSENSRSNLGLRCRSRPSYLKIHF